MPWVYALLGYLWGAVSACWLILYAVKRAQRKATPFRYRCHVEGCYFVASANDMAVLDHFATQHERSHHA